ncbi:dual specificity phosphatase [Apiospora hydei]|uniref:Dual specificity phosphatase n=1 Tax=Apiospora hydei TaxID=1337664 RepID=A0ABR1X0G6_9PEZI
MPFRDAGYSQADYGITVQDVVYGVWKAKEESCCQLDNFDLDEYERFERVEHGDFNWVSPHFLAFASPQHSPVAPVPQGSEAWNALPKTLAAVDAHPTLPQPFKNVLKHFSERNIGLKRGIAVHCKAGLGRTGCLIGAYLIYRHGFTANEIIAFMRFMRPGMVVGPQQHWLHLNQGVFREWWIEERIERKLRKEMAANAAGPSTPSRGHQKANMSRATTTPSHKTSSSRTPLSEVDHERNNIGVQEDYLPAPTPGQPRKTSRVDRHHPYQRSAINQAVEEEQGAGQETEVLSVQRQPSEKSRSVSHTTTTTTVYEVVNDASNDAENIGSARPKNLEHVTQSPTRSASASGVLTKVRSGKRSTDSNRSSGSNPPAAGVRKTSGRVGSVNNTSSSARKVSAM